MPALIPTPSADVLAVSVGAVVGALSRYQVGRLAGEWIAKDSPRLQPYTGWHTAAINVSGSFVLGSVAAMPTATTKSSAATSTWFNLSPTLSPRTKLLLGVGFCGSFTTFSTYSVDIATWLAQGQTHKALSYVAVNNVGGVLAAAAGMILVKKICG